MKNNLFIAVAVALVAVIGIGVVVSSSVNQLTTSVAAVNATLANLSSISNQSDFAGLSEREVEAISLRVGTPTKKFSVSSSGSAVAVGTTTPSTLGDVVVDGTGTSTLMLTSSTAGRGGCLQLENSAGTQTKAYIVSTSWVIAAGTCK